MFFFLSKSSLQNLESLLECNMRTSKIISLSSVHFFFSHIFLSLSHTRSPPCICSRTHTQAHTVGYKANCRYTESSAGPTHTHSLVSGCWNGLYMTWLMDRGTFCQVTERSSSYWLAEASPGARALRLAAFEVAERRVSQYSRLLFWPEQGRTAALCQS